MLVTCPRYVEEFREWVAGKDQECVVISIKSGNFADHCRKLSGRQLGYALRNRICRYFCHGCLVGAARTANAGVIWCRYL